jgi:UDP-N-acetylmuramate--alanine ligase
VTDLHAIQNVYFLGIGGIGMSALARYFSITGMQVAGYDRTPTDLTAELEKEGIPVHFEDDPGLIPPAFLTMENTLVVFTPAVPADHKELAFFRERQFHVIKRAEMLGLITRQKKTVAVSGTHGKTTVSTMIAHLMAKSGMGCNAFLGGISRNFNSNLVLDPASAWVIAEADEFDRSFLRLYPQVAVVTAMDPDHLDIYGTAEELHAAFNIFVSQVHADGMLLMKKDIPLEKKNMPAHVYTYSLTDSSADFHASNIRLEKRKYHFDLAGPGIKISNISLLHPGLVNVENAIAATALASLLGMKPDLIRTSMESFEGIRRRFEYHVNTDNMVYIDDYAHHPRELEATILSVRELYPGKKITGIFQPHLYSRTRDFAEGFAKSLSLLDQLVLLEIYPAREIPIEGVDAAMIFNKVEIKEKYMCSREQLLDMLPTLRIEVLITLGAGDIDKMVEPIRNFIQTSSKP